MVQLKNFRGIPHSHKDKQKVKEIFLKIISLRFAIQKDHNCHIKPLK
jgi:hypothetical protein